MKKLILIIYLTVASWIISAIKAIRFKRAVKKANRLHRLTRRRWHVINGENNSFAVVDNRFIDYYNKQRIGTKLTIEELLKIALYSTPTSKQEYSKLTKI